MRASRSRRGAYFLASDPVLELARAFLESFRRFNPELPLALVPYDSNHEEIARLGKRHAFTVFEDPAALARCDRISERLHGSVTGEYRKLAFWEGPFEEFIYFDVDTIVLEDASFIWPWLENLDFVASQSHIPENRKFVWKDGFGGAGVLSERQLAFAGSTGFLGSRRGLILAQDALDHWAEVEKLAPGMALEYKEQALLNFLALRAGLRCSSLSLIAAQNPDLDIAVERWAGAPLTGIHDGRVSERKPRLLFVHWAGLWQRGLHKSHPLWQFYGARD